MPEASSAENTAEADDGEGTGPAGRTRSAAAPGTGRAAGTADAAASGRSRSAAPPGAAAGCAPSPPAPAAAGPAHATATPAGRATAAPDGGAAPGPFEGMLPGEYGYTPPNGFPVDQLRVGAPGSGPWPDRMRTLLRTPMSERPAYERTRKRAADRAERTPPAGSVPRVLDLSLRIGELLLASGEGAEDVEAAMLGVTHALGLDRCEPQVTFTLLAISHQPSLIEAPVTAERVVRRRSPDYTRLAAVYRLVGDITSEQAGVEEAYRRLASIRRNRHPYRGWAISLASGALAGAATLLVGGQLDRQALLIFLAAFAGAALGDRLAWLVSARGLPEFYQFVAAATPAAALGVVITLNGSGLRGSAVVTGGLFAVLPGRALVAAVQDGLTGYYITAAARLLEVVYLVVGIVVGVLLVLYCGLRLGAQLHPEQGLAAHSQPMLQLPAAMALTLCFAVVLQTNRRELPIVVLNSAVGWAVYGTLTAEARLSPVIATGVAAGLVGLFGQLASRLRYASALPYVTAALGPLMPGSALYLGLLAMAQGRTDGLTAVGRASALALALAVGVNLGGEAAGLFLRVTPLEGPGRTAAAPARRGAKRTRGY